MAIRWEKLTVKSQEAVQAAQGLAAEHGNPEVLPVHLMAALLEDREGVVLPVLEKVGVPVELALGAERVGGDWKVAEDQRRECAAGVGEFFAEGSGAGL